MFLNQNQASRQYIQAINVLASSVCTWNLQVLVYMISMTWSTICPLPAVLWHPDRKPILQWLRWLGLIYLSELKQLNWNFYLGDLPYHCWALSCDRNVVEALKLSGALMTTLELGVWSIMCNELSFRDSPITSHCSNFIIVFPFLLFPFFLFPSVSLSSETMVSAAFCC